MTKIIPPADHRKTRLRGWEIRDYFTRDLIGYGAGRNRAEAVVELSRRLGRKLNKPMRVVEMPGPAEEWVKQDEHLRRQGA